MFTQMKAARIEEKELVTLPGMSISLTVTVCQLSCQVKHQPLVNSNCIPAVM